MMARRRMDGGAIGGAAALVLPRRAACCALREDPSDPIATKKRGGSPPRFCRQYPQRKRVIHRPGQHAVRIVATPSREEGNSNRDQIKAEYELPHPRTQKRVIDAPIQQHPAAESTDFIFVDFVPSQRKSPTLVYHTECTSSVRTLAHRSIRSRRLTATSLSIASWSTCGNPSSPIRVPASSSSQRWINAPRNRFQGRIALRSRSLAARGVPCFPNGHQFLGDAWYVEINSLK